MGISPDVMVMTRTEFGDAEDRAFQRGVARGRFEQNWDNSHQDNPPSGPSKSKDVASPDAAGGPKFNPEGWTFEDHGNGVVYVRTPSGKHAAIGYMAPGDMVLSAILQELVGAVLMHNAPAEPVTS